ncbi:MAG: hypothetical protein ACOYZ7_20160 [Chloroflexota bacterium]
MSRVYGLKGLPMLSLLLLAFSHPAQASTREGSIPSWLWLLGILGVLLALLLWRRLSGGSPAAGLPVAEQVEPVVEPSSPDDLKIVEGIGPKIESLLHQRGILTLAQLAAVEVSQLQDMLQQANLRIADPSTWPEQARLAAAGDWAALEVLQNELKGGRRV